jgi:hypothetical protein
MGNNIWEAMKTTGDLIGFVGSRQRLTAEQREDPQVEETKDIATIGYISGYIAVEGTMKGSQDVIEMPSQTFEAWHGIED